MNRQRSATHERATERPAGRRSPRGDSRSDLRADSRADSRAEHRYTRGRRRTGAEPLTASWEPVAEPEDDAEDDYPPPGRFRRLTSTYGWRIYAIPVLVVVTVLVILDGTKGGPGSSQAAGADGGPVVTEQPAGDQSLDIPTAELPDGGAFARFGSGSWRVVDGSTPRVGTGRLYRYTVEIENGIDPSQVGGEDEDFAKFVDQTLADPRGWTHTGKISVQRIGPGQGKPDFRISLTTPMTDHRPDVCGFGIKYESSCYTSAKGRVVINLARWVRGAKAYGPDMLGYRQYAINHEVGHAFGNGHVGCPRNNAPAPVMMQQSFGVSNDYVARVNRVDPYNKNAVTPDHKVCMPNAWPNPADSPTSTTN